MPREPWGAGPGPINRLSRRLQERAEYGSGRPRQQHSGSEWVVAFVVVGVLMAVLMLIH